MDIFEQLRELPSVVKVSNLYPQATDKMMTFVFFICPKMKGSGFRLNSNKTGFDAEYLSGILSSSAGSAIERATQFLAEFGDLGQSYVAKAIYASADALLLPSVATMAPTPPIHPAIEIVANEAAVLENLGDFGKMYREKPWRNVPQKVCEFERQRLTSILPSNTPPSVVSDFIERTWSGFALDGILIRRGYFGPNPVLLGVESPGVLVLQNSALPRNEWLPVIQLA